MTTLADLRAPAVSAKALTRKRRRKPPEVVGQTESGDEFTITCRVIRRGCLFQLYWERDGYRTESAPLCLPDDLAVTDVEVP